ncbi:alpha/beta hydrolase [Flavobacterium saliperosum]|uniref:Pimeloyl-ACP methyl ester carboxylesterase n=2 Tax=Flavobacterium saliperosum TaxID=329186 RepID=A0A1G4V254_9FLAO|nr:alpha/beta hydrolase [Flavobacterium saliperosum]SCX00031.1 Pimeloyl-ACP methyl ester carboxylesterase [Flavobacterium saliperosum]
MSRIPVYFMPGLAASSKIFEKIQLPEAQFEVHLLEWFLPKPNETLEGYAERMAEEIKHDNAVLIGVSFGGILVQEIAKMKPVRKTIIISSVKCKDEFPLRMKLARNTKVYKLIPTSMFSNVEFLLKYGMGEKVKERLELYKMYLSVNDKKYLDWAIEHVLIWDRKEVDEKVVHIHGDNDDVFPIKNIKNCIVVKGGTHAMILFKSKWMNENLPRIITE